MKKIFPIIIGLISLSLVGIIGIQLLWLRNMVLLRKEQVQHKIQDAIERAGDELIVHKSTFTHENKNPRGLMTDDNTLQDLRPNTIGHRLDIDDINKILKRAYVSHDLENIDFEFAVITLSTGYGKASQGFQKVFEEKDPKNKNFQTPLNSPSGSDSENISPDEMLIVVVRNYKSIVYESLWLPIIIAILFTVIIITAFYLTVRTMLKQKKLSEIKNDFINNMTHEFKTPLATISLAVDALRNDKVIHDKQKMDYFSTIIKEENKRMNRQVETILKAALLDKQEVQLLLRPMHVHAIVKEVVENFSLQLEDKKGKAELMLNAENDLVDVDEVHFSNLVNNLIDNAIKYSKEEQPPEIRITTHSTPKILVITIEDNGIGMNKETIKRVFEKFYRAHTGNIHNVKGFGLGLSYVKTMIEAHGGDIKVDSVPGKGSTFVIELPLKKLQHQAVLNPIPA